mmetsp:Transcript_2883/g.8414  ORF Transcript_2883/g.8414 Transcript_2883/m.8414 type:complete len:252 (+) Transcript_2883:3-758(+)
MAATTAPARSPWRRAACVATPSARMRRVNSCWFTRHSTASAPRASAALSSCFTSCFTPGRKGPALPASSGRCASRAILEDGPPLVSPAALALRLPPGRTRHISSGGVAGPKGAREAVREKRSRSKASRASCAAVTTDCSLSSRSLGSLRCFFSDAGCFLAGAQGSVAGGHRSRHRCCTMLRNTWPSRSSSTWWASRCCWRRCSRAGPATSSPASPSTTSGSPFSFTAAAVTACSRLQRPCSRSTNVIAHAN